MMKKKIGVTISLIGVLGLALLFKNNNSKEILFEDSADIKNTIAMYKSEDGTNYTEIAEIPDSGYVVNEEKTYCTNDNKTQVKGKVKTIKGNTVITNINKSDKCYVWFDKYIPTASETILANITVNEGTPTTFASGATTDEGVYSAEDGMYGGTSYYWRGAVTNNYVKFANFCWRIVRINGDGTIRLIYDGTTCHPNGALTADSLIQPTSGTTNYQYNASYNQSNYVGWTYSGTSQRTTGGTASNAKTQTENWFTANITGANLSKVDTSAKFCNDRNTASGSTWAIRPNSPFYYAAYGRLYTTKAPTLSCPSSDTYTLKIGAITADEAMFAGGWSSNNTSYYLYNGQNYWTMSPLMWGGSNVIVLAVNTEGSLTYWGMGAVNNSYGLRPVINLKTDTLFATGGTGTQSNPYVVS